MRRKNGCVDCREVREIAAHGRCFRCYRSHVRAGDRDRESAGIDRHAGAVRREHTKLLRGFLNVMVGLNELGASVAEVTSIRKMLDPYLNPVARFLVPETEIEARTADVNSEHNFGAPFTVHMFPDEGAKSTIDLGHHADTFGAPAEGI